jgi:hypothetical protein
MHMEANILNKHDLQKQENGIDINNDNCNLTISNYINNIGQMSKATAFEGAIMPLYDFMEWNHNRIA